MIDTSKLNSWTDAINKAIAFHDDPKNEGAFAPSTLEDILHSVHNLQAMMREVVEFHAEQKLIAPHRELQIKAPDVADSTTSLRLVV